MKILKFVPIHNPSVFAAFIIAEHEDFAEEFLKTETLIKCVCTDIRDLDDIPQAAVHYDRNGSGVWKSNIQPF